MPAGRTPLSDLPFWPRVLSRDEAARYVGVSVDVFDDEVRAGLWPPGRPRGRRGGRLTWDRAVLDAVLDREAGLDAATPTQEAAQPPADAPLPVSLRDRMDATTPHKRPERRPKAAH